MARRGIITVMVIDYRCCTVTVGIVLLLMQCWRLPIGLMIDC